MTGVFPASYPTLGLPKIALRMSPFPPFHRVTLLSHLANSYSSHTALPTSTISSPLNNLSQSTEFSQVRTFSLILFLQYLHLTVCLMISSRDTQVYACTTA